MKHSKHHDNARSAGPRLEPVRFEFTHPTASTVCVAGTFNDWQVEAKPMHPLGGGNWLKETALAPGTYEYCLVVDGQRMPDPLVRETVPNPFGGRNSVLRVASSPEAAQSRRRRKFTPEKHKQTANTENMNKQTQAISNDMGQLAEDARALMAATADVAGEKVGEARQRLAVALERGKEIYGRVREQAVEGAKAADEAMHEHPYQAIAIGVGVGALIGYLVARRCTCNRD